MSKAKLIYALAGLVREVRLSIEEKNERIRQLERKVEVLDTGCRQPQAHPARCGCEVKS